MILMKWGRTSLTTLLNLCNHKLLPVVLNDTYCGQKQDLIIITAIVTIKTILWSGDYVPGTILTT